MIVLGGFGVGVVMALVNIAFGVFMRKRFPR
jgi:hypothetical protein